MSKRSIMNPRFHLFDNEVVQTIESYMSPDEVETLEDFMNKPEFTPEDIQYIIKNLSNEELSNVLNFGSSVLSRQTIDYLRRHNLFSLIPRKDPERSNKIITLMIHPEFPFDKRIVLRELSGMVFPIETIEQLYDKFIDRDIIDTAISHSDMTNPVSGLYLGNVLYQALSNNDIQVVELLLLKYRDRIDLLRVYKKSLAENNARVRQKILDSGFIPPKTTEGRRVCSIVRLNCSDMTKRESIRLFKQLDQQQQDYFIFIHPLRNNCITDSQFFLIAHDGDNICGSMFVEKQEDNVYYVYSFATRSLMDPAFGGIGKQMIDYLKKIAREDGIEAIHLSSLPSAVSFYKKMGFQAYDSFMEYELEYRL